MNSVLVKNAIYMNQETFKERTVSLAMRKLSRNCLWRQGQSNKLYSSDNWQCLGSRYPPVILYRNWKRDRRHSTGWMWRFFGSSIKGRGGGGLMVLLSSYIFLMVLFMSINKWTILTRSLLRLQHVPLKGNPLVTISGQDKEFYMWHISLPDKEFIT